MSQLILFNMMTVDGFFEGPRKEIEWHNVDKEFNDFAIEQLNKADCLFFGRLTYELMKRHWTSPDAMKNDPVVAGKMNSMNKVVFSTTLQKADWQNTLLIKENVEAEIKKLKQQYEKDILLLGSAWLASTLIRLGLIDQLRIMVNPVLLGQGEPLFKHKDLQTNLRHLNTRTFNSGNVLLTYEAVIK
jgi:dihydrofolate reductase